jgi:hypothetical protein
VVLVGDDTVDGHKGKKVYNKVRHCNPVRSTHSCSAWRYGHKWGILAVLLRLPFARAIFPQVEGGTTIEKLPQPLREVILTALAPSI